jgi:hypothetical protein
MTSAKTTTDHATIKRWAEARKGRPAAVRQTGGQHDPGILRFDFGEPEDNLEPISWEDFFEKFEQSGLALLYQEQQKGGQQSRFFKFVHR